MPEIGCWASDFTFGKESEREGRKQFSFCFAVLGNIDFIAQP